jgi:hypothetical protein
MGGLGMTLPAVAVSASAATAGRRTRNCTKSGQPVREGRAGRGLPGTSEENQMFLWGGASGSNGKGVGVPPPPRF